MDFIKAKEEVAKELLQKKPYLFFVDDLVAKTENGVVNIALRVYNGFVTDVVVIEKDKRYTFKRQA